MQSSTRGTTSLAPDAFQSQQRVAAQPVADNDRVDVVQAVDLALQGRTQFVRVEVQAGLHPFDGVVHAGLPPPPG